MIRLHVHLRSATTEFYENLVHSLVSSTYTKKQLTSLIVVSFNQNENILYHNCPLPEHLCSILNALRQIYGIDEMGQ